MNFFRVTINGLTLSNERMGNCGTKSRGRTHKKTHPDTTNAAAATAKQQLDALWGPIMHKVQNHLHESKNMNQLFNPNALLDAFDKAANLDHKETWPHAAASVKLLQTLAQNWNQRNSLQNEAHFVSTCMVRLVHFLALALKPTLGSDSVEEFSLRMRPWEELLERYGAPRPLLVAALDGPSKGILLCTDLAMRSTGSMKVSCTRSAALWEIFTTWRATPYGARAGGEDGAVTLYSRFASSHGAWEDGEGHGPRKELFSIVAQQLLHGGKIADGSIQESHGKRPADNQLPALLPYDESSRGHWFDTSQDANEESLLLMSLAGWMLAQSIANRSPLCASLPIFLFERLLSGDEFECSLSTLQAHNAVAAAGIRKVQSLSESDFISFAALEECAGMKRDEYVKNTVKRLLGGAQLEALRAGWEQGIPRELLAPLQFSSNQLAAAVCGVSCDEVEPIEIRECFHVQEDDELVSCPVLRNALWEVIDSWETSRKRAFLRFVTGNDRPPPSQSEFLCIEMPFAPIGQEETIAMGEKLPQAHTCANTLELPNYYLALAARRGVSANDIHSSANFLVELRDIIEKRFSTAVDCCDEYGLDELAPPQHGVPPLQVAEVARGRVVETHGNSSQRLGDTLQIDVAEALGAASPIGGGDTVLALSGPGTLVKEEQVVGAEPVALREMAQTLVRDGSDASLSSEEL